MVADEFVELFEGAFVEEELDALAGAEFSFFVLALAAFGAAASFGFRGALAKLFETIAILGGSGHRESAPEKARTKLRFARNAILYRLEIFLAFVFMELAKF
jgi:hypothetical protein